MHPATHATNAWKTINNQNITKTVDILVSSLSSSMIFLDVN